MSWLITNVKQSIWSWLADIASDFMSKAFNLITDTIVEPTNINKYFNISEYLVYVQIMAANLLVLKVVYEVFKQNSGGMIATEEKSFGTLALQTIFGGTCIFLLPWSVSNFLLPLNNAAIGVIQSIGVKVDVSKFNKYLSLTSGIVSLGAFIIFGTLILAVAFLILGILGAIRYVEILIAVIVAPFAAISAVGDQSMMKGWFLKTSKIVFTQVLQIFLLQLLISIMAKCTGPMLYVYSIGTIVAMVKGPKILQGYLHSTGMGAAAAKTAKIMVTRSTREVK